MTTEQVGDAAYAAGVRLHELSTHRASLEQAFMELTADSVEYHATGQTGGRGAAQTGHRRGRHSPAAPAGPAPRKPRTSTRGGRTEMAAVTQQNRPAAPHCLRRRAGPT